MKRTAETISAELGTFETEGLILTVKLRNSLLRAANELLLEATR